MLPFILRAIFLEKEEFNNISRWELCIPLMDYSSCLDITTLGFWQYLKMLPPFEINISQVSFIVNVYNYRIKTIKRFQNQRCTLALSNICLRLANLYWIYLHLLLICCTRWWHTGTLVKWCQESKLTSHQENHILESNWRGKQFHCVIIIKIK